MRGSAWQLGSAWWKLLGLQLRDEPLALRDALYFDGDRLDGCFDPRQPGRHVSRHALRALRSLSLHPPCQCPNDGIQENGCHRRSRDDADDRNQKVWRNAKEHMISRERETDASLLRCAREG